MCSKRSERASVHDGGEEGVRGVVERLRQRRHAVAERRRRARRAPPRAAHRPAARPSLRASASAASAASPASPASPACTRKQHFLPIGVKHINIASLLKQNTDRKE